MRILLVSVCVAGAADREFERDREGNCIVSIYCKRSLYKLYMGPAGVVRQWKNMHGMERDGRSLMGGENFKNAWGQQHTTTQCVF
jgi:hypothetical protein